ncbi:cardiolipin synthase [Spirochaeta africana]|uniref:Cardiolipin synthase n=1 Tax=Spirochaeta africana (strain ATCC 700263 / DSM 8902 / Z-7692) TaxID=889378 RepID=H9UIM8_SPIAZ|nr:cardiolipin synthase [Spirochaeta africana]AFG37371.1 phosphatidylserine/phosphatidylglycerophosphate/cardiolipin synthase [Spirochaeta africana DSM 8902]
MQEFVGFIQRFWPVFTGLVVVVLSGGASIHALLYKRDSRATVAWVGLIWLVPFVGSILYILLGINRIRRRVSGLRGDERQLQAEIHNSCTPDELASGLAEHHRHIQAMARLVGTLTQRDLQRGNTVEPLFDGDSAYPAMLDAIESARYSIGMTTYIFDNDVAGTRFADALGRAVERGVEVRVIVDSVGARYSMPPITFRLTSRGVRTALFMPTLLPWATPYMNLRSHRKILVVDGVTGFTGGMNIRFNHLIHENPPHPTHDIHFRVTGPVVHQLQATFAEDWQFCTREQLGGDRWFPAITPQGSVLARAIPDGPDKDFDKMRLSFLGALATAQHRVRIMTPYFLPDSALISALNTCAMRGVRVDIVLPRNNNLKMVAWAAQAQLWQLLEWGCNIWFSPPPFDHSKLMVVDGILSLIGSANWDPRSLRLNFEFGLECYNAELGEQLEHHVETRIASAHRVTLTEVNQRPLLVKLRDAAMRLAAPYL